MRRISEAQVPSDTVGEETVSERKLMAQVAREHYLNEKSNLEIAEQFGISRFKVARLLIGARETGIVKIQIDDVGLPDPELSQELANWLGIEKCIVVRSEGTEKEIRRQVGAEAAGLLSNTLVEGEVFGVAWGRTLTETTSQLESLPNLTIVQLTGFLGDDLETSPIGVAQGVAARSGGRVYPLFVPLYVQDSQIADKLKEHPDLRRAMALYPKVTTALLSVGGWDPQDTQVRNALPEDMRLEADRKGCVADIAGILVGKDGAPVDPKFQDRTLGISYKQLANVPHVIAVATGEKKAPAIEAVVRGGLVNELVVDHALAKALLSGHAQTG